MGKSDSDLEGEFRKFFHSELSLLKGVASNPLLRGRADKVRILLASSCASGSAICELGCKREYYYAEMVMLSRSFIEKIINYCYLLCCDENEYNKFLLHPFYRMYHMLDRKKYTKDSSMNIKYSDINSIKNDKKVQEALNVFSESNPRMNWSSKSVDEKVSVVSEKTSLDAGIFLMNTLSVYSQSSEALHGSLYGCAFHTGAYSIDVNSADPKDVEVNIVKNTCLIYSQMGAMVHNVVVLLSKETELSEILEASKENHKTCVKLLKVMFN